MGFKTKVKSRIHLIYGLSFLLLAVSILALIKENYIIGVVGIIAALAIDVILLRLNKKIQAANYPTDKKTF